MKTTRKSVSMWIRRRLDIGWRDLFYGMFRCFVQGSEEESIKGIKNLWPHPERIIPFLSVRTGFDLLLEALDFPEESEVIITAVTLPDMVRVIEEHGLTPVPVDIIPETMGCSADQFRKALNPNVKAVVLTHLFGGRMPADDIIALAKQNGLFVIEDLAQGFSGCADDGHPEADVSMFSFGTIKTAAALGGAVFSVRSRDAREKMVRMLGAYPVQKRSRYLLKLLKYTFLKAFTYRWTFGMLVRLFKIVRIDYDSLIHKWSRGFPGPGFFRKIRHRPSVPLCAVLRRRLIQYDEKRLKDQKNKGTYLVSMLHEVIECPGSSAGNHVYWVFPVCIPWKAEFIDTLRTNGFDATGKHSMSVVCLPEGSGLESPHQANRLLEQIVYLPFYPEIPFNEIKRMGGIASSFIQKHA